MLNIENKYLAMLKEGCEKVTVDFFPQVEASELLYKVITLEDIYLPLRLEKTGSDDVSSDKMKNALLRGNKKRDTIDYDELIARIDKRIEELEFEAEAAKEDFQDELKSVTRENKDKAGKRFMITAAPGCGKTTFCKRLVLADINDDGDFFEKYREYGFDAFRNSFPVIINCRFFENISVQELCECDFESLVYRIYKLSFGEKLCTTGEDELSLLLKYKADGNVCIIVDGFDEILSKEKKEAFSKALNNYIISHPLTNLIVTMRKYDELPKAVFSFTDFLKIKVLTASDIKTFCEKWYNIVFAIDPLKQNAYEKITKQILDLASRDYQIRELAVKPLTLSLLLMLSRSDGRLPENKADLFNDILKLYIHWAVMKFPDGLKEENMRLYLGYIATKFTKQKKLICSYPQLEEIIKECNEDLRGYFSQDISCFDVSEIIRAVSRSGIFECTQDGKAYVFSVHRQMQEYLTAYAIVKQTADKEYNEMMPIDIFKDKYDIPHWREIILFASLLDDGRLRQSIATELLEKVRAGDEYTYTNLLFEMIVNGCKLNTDKKSEIYDVLFKDQITDKQIANIYTLTKAGGRISADFCEYIDRGFAKSVEKGESEYGYAKAIILASNAMEEGKSPLLYAEDLIFSDIHSEAVLGTQILLLFAWCRYADIQNVFSPFYAKYKMSTKVAKRLKNLLDEKDNRLDIAKCIKDCILSGFVKFSQIFSEDDIIEYGRILDGNESVPGEIVLSLAPVENCFYGKSPVSLSDKTKEKYLARLNKEFEEEKYDDIIFTLNVCAVIGCFEDPVALYKELYRAKAVYTPLKTHGFMGKAGYQRICADNNLVNYHNGLYKFYPDGKSNLNRKLAGFMRKRLTFSMGDVDSFVAGMLRRGEVLRFQEITQEGTKEISATDLLAEGIENKDIFSLINYALLVSDTYKNSCGDFEKGLELLKSVSGISKKKEDWIPIFEWWIEAALENGETEGLIVLYWLTELGLEECFDFDNELLGTLIEMFKNASDIFKGKEKKCIAFLEGRLKPENLSSKNIITVRGDDGEEVTYDVLFTFDSDETGKSYIVYTDNTLDETGQIQVYASTYNPNDPGGRLVSIETDKEWKIIETILEELQRHVKEGNS